MRMPPSLERAVAARHSYRQILRASSIIGSASVLQIAIGIVRTKVFALWLGPAGVGLMGLFSTVCDLARSVAGLGLNQSGVRQIAESQASGDALRIARTVAALRATALTLGSVGALGMMLAAPWLSQLTFGDRSRSLEIALLGAALFFRLVADGHGALIHGLRRIGDMARADLLAAGLGSLLAIALVFAWHEAGVAPSLVAIAAMSAATSWWYGQRARRDLAAAHAPATGWPKPRLGELGGETRALLRLGLALMGSGLLTLGAAWAVRVIIVRETGLEAAGLYQSAWTLGGLYVGIVLQAMGADYYPRLVGLAGDNEAANRLVNEQTLVNMLLGGAGVLATMSIAPLALPLLYSRAFDGAQEVLRWICLGMALRAVTWPMGTLLVAKGAHKLLLGSDLVWALVHVGAAAVLVRTHGLAGAGMAFFAAYLLQALLLVPLTARLSGLRWTRTNRQQGAWMGGLALAAFVGFQVLPGPWALAFGLAATLMGAVTALRLLQTLVSLQPAHARWTRWWPGRATEKP